MIFRILTVLFLSASIGFAQEGKPFYKRQAPQTPKSPGRNFDVLHYRIDQDWFGLFNSNDVRVPGSTTLWLVPDDTLSFVRLQYGSMDLLSATINDQPATIKPEPEGMFLVKSGQLFTHSDTLKIKIDFKRQNVNEFGLYYYRPTISVKIPEKMAYTMAEPYEGRNWFPCYDYPDDRATVETFTRVPAGYTVTSNGLLQSVKDNGDNTQTFHWKAADPMPSYLVVVNASKFDTFHQVYHKVTNPNDSIPILNYFWATDRNGSTFNAVNALKNLPKMMEVYSSVYGEYPFEKYGNTIVSPFYFGGMEHQTITTGNRSWLRGNDDGFAHELMHQWFGDLITCKTFDDIWLNEGFATYGEAIWNEQMYGSQARKAVSAADRDGYLAGYNTIPVWGPPENLIFNYATTYSKAGWILNMFRKTIGDDAFFGLNRHYVETRRFSSISTEEFIAMCNTYLGKDYTWFFNQWLFVAGHPVLDLTWNAEQTGLINLRVDQRSMSGTDYRFLLDVKLQGSAKDTVVTLEITGKSEIFSIPVGFKVLSLTADPDVWLLAEINSVVVGVNDMEKPSSFSVSQNYPNPFNGGTVFTLNSPSVDKIQFEVYDLTGKKVTSESIPAGQKSVTWNPAHSGAELTSGVYFYRFTTGIHSASGKMIYLK